MNKTELINKLKNAELGKRVKKSLPEIHMEKLKALAPNQKVLLTVAGAVVIAGSVITVIDYVDRKRRDKASHVVELLCGLAGVAVGAVLASEPRRVTEREKLVVDDMFTEEDLELASAQIRESLNGDADRGAPVAAPKRTVEVDEETSIEDFI